MPATSWAQPRWTCRVSENGNHRLVYSGDIGRSGLPIVRNPEPPTGPIDTLIVESTYANRQHESFDQAETRLAEAVRRVASRGGKLLIPAFAVGRAQELIYSLHRLSRAGQIPQIPIYLDSPLAVDITTVFRMHPEVFDRAERFIETTNELFDFPLLHYVRDVSQIEGSEFAERAGGDHCRFGDGRIGPHPAPSGPRHWRPPEPGALCGLSGRAYPGSPNSRAGRNGSAFWARSTSGELKWNRSPAIQLMQTGTSSGPGFAGWEGRFAGRS